jgi:ABC-2 type transport system ATP-binding protein
MSGFLLEDEPESYPEGGRAFGPARPRRAARARDGLWSDGMEPSAASPVPALAVQGLTKLFREKRAVDDITFSVARGRFFGFLGPNGAGKSTTIKMLTGLLRPTAGEVRIEGRDLRRELLEVKRLIGVLPEELPLYERLSGEEYLHFAARMYGLGREEARRRTDELLDFLSLAEDRGTLVLDYSQGMKKKLALAAALIHSPRVLFLDEPLNGIDPVSGRVVTDLLRRLAAKGVTLFFTTHVLDVVERLCDEVAVIDRGRIVAQGTLDEIRAQRAVGHDASLEDVFLKLVQADVVRRDLAWLG